MSVKSDRGSGAWPPRHGIDRAVRGRSRFATWTQAVNLVLARSSYGYDVVCAPEVRIFNPAYQLPRSSIRRKEVDESSFVDMWARSASFPPNSFALARTVEYFRSPRAVDDLLGQVQLRSLRHHRARHAARARVGRAR